VYLSSIHALHLVALAFGAVYVGAHAYIWWRMGAL
jgi:hypothetical protein